MHNHRLVWLKRFRTSSEMPRLYGSPSLHRKTSSHCPPKERGVLPSSAQGSIVGKSGSAGDEILTRQLGTGVAGRRDHVRLHVRPRGASSRSGHRPCSPARPPSSRKGCLWHLALGQALARTSFRLWPQMNSGAANISLGLYGGLEDEKPKILDSPQSSQLRYRRRSGGYCMDHRVV
jgi:hypothetical protein